MRNEALNEAKKRGIVEDQVGRLLSRSKAFKSLSAPLRSEVLANTAAIVRAMADTTSQPQADPYALPYAGALDSPPSPIDPTASPSSPPSGSSSPQQADTFNPQSVAAGVAQVGRMVKEVGFPAFVASLIQGTFHAIVSSSIEQMRAYAELVKSVAQSLNDFRDQNVTENQGKDNLVSRYPNIFKLTIVDGTPMVRPREGVDTSGALPDFHKDLGLDEDVTDLDDETIDTKLVPAARQDLARGRQQLLATMVLMGINRIVVTDGKINAKLQFQFSAKDQAKTTAVHYDYWNAGQIQAQSGDASGTDNTFSDDPSSDGGSSYARGSQMMSMPDVKVTSQSNTESTASLQASGALFGEVSINFRSETFPLERMADTNQIARLQQAQAGRGAPAPSGPAPAQAAQPLAMPVTTAPPAAAGPAAAAPARA